MVQKSSVIVLAWMTAAALSAADPAPGARLNFVSCPIVRDTKTVPCFLAEHEGELYFLGIQQDIGAEFYPPQLLHEVLVEGVVGEGPRVCGGIPLSPVAASVLPELNRACNTILPAEEGIEAPPAARPAGPSVRRTSLGAPPPPPEVPTAPFSQKEFAILFDFDSDFVNPRMTRLADRAVTYAKASGGRVEITGYRSATKLSRGETLIEADRIGERRAKKLADIFVGLGIPSSRVSVSSKSEIEPEDGASGVKARRATVTIRP